MPQVSRNLICVDRYIDSDEMIPSMKSAKRVLQKVEYNPFELLFVVLPKEFGVASLEETFERIDQCKKLFDDYYDWVQNESANIIYDVWGGKEI